ncbi:AAA family ATPase [Saccharopolyspora taberi]|uniref:AAA family ATPase n=1 Tax=Saccharopolyspora taberi TaxID=60895 RepID=A0ABN3VIK8_9PSEU
MSVPYGRSNPDADAWCDPADGAVYPGGVTAAEGLAERTRRKQQDPDTAETAGAGAGRRVVWRRASEIAVRRRAWLWTGRVPLGETTLLVGHAGVGKSQAAAWLSAQVSRGRLAGELEGRAASVLYVATEDSWEATVAPRLVAAGADMDRVLAVHTETTVGTDIVAGGVSLAVDVPSLRRAAEETGARVIVLDALLSAMTGTDLGKQGAVRSLLEPLSQLAQDLGLAVVGVAHFRKSTGADPLLAISGSAEFGQVVRSAIGFARDPEAGDGSGVLSVIKTNLAPMTTPSLRYVIAPASVPAADGQLTSVGRFRLVGESERGVADLLTDLPVSSEERCESAEARLWLRDFLLEAGGRAEAGVVIRAAEAAGLSRDQVKKARIKIGARTVKAGFAGGRWEWVLPDGHASGDEDAEGAGT